MNRSLFIILLIGLFFSTSVAFAQLNGTYTIGGTSPDYANISAAVSDLNNQGISGPVWFQIRPGIYDEQVTISDFYRSGNADDLVTFTRPNAYSQVTWRYTTATPATNWVVRLEGASYIKLNGIQFEAAAPNPTGRLIVFAEGAHNNTIRLCTLEGHLGVSNYTGSLIWREDLGNHASNVFENNTFVNGYRGVDWAGPGGGYNSTGMEVRENTFSGQQDTGIYIFGTEGAIVTTNQVYSAAWSDPDYRGIYVGSSLSVTSPVNAQITQNTVNVQIGSIGISLFESQWVVQGQTHSGSVVANNMLAVRDSANGQYGLYIAADEVEIYHNTVRTTGPNAYPLFVYSEYENHVIKNNLFSADGGAEAMYIGDPETYESDYNNFYSTGITLIHANDTDYTSLTAYQNGELGPDDHSTSMPVTFFDTAGTNDLHLAPPSDNEVALLAPLLVDYTTDVDGDLRSIFAVYKGADEGVEFLPLDNRDTSNGFYTVSGNNPDFFDPNNAIFHLNQRGIKGPVTFRIRAGIYNTHATLSFKRHWVPGVSSETVFDDIVRIRAANRNNQPILQHFASGSADNWIFKLQDMNNVEIKKLNFFAFGPAPYGRILVFDGQDTANNVVGGCTFTGLSGETSTEAALIYGSTIPTWGYGQHDNSFTNNIFTDGSYGIYLESERGGGYAGQDALFEDNSFIEQAAGAISIHSHNEALFSHNTVTSFYPDVIGFEFGGHANDVIGNQLHVNGNGAKGIVLSSANGFTYSKAEMKNNIINAKYIGVELTNFSHLYNIFHNTIRASHIPLYIYDAGLGLEIVNNILVNNTAEPALFVTEGADVDLSDYNVVTNSGGGTLVHWDGLDYSTLEEYQSATGMDPASVDTTVSFVDVANGDLHLAGASDGDPDMTGTPLADVTDDIDGDLRSTTAPYKGADEASTVLWN